MNSSKFRSGIRKAFYRLTWPNTGIYGNLRSRIAKHIRYGKILTLDAGCGDGFYSNYCVRHRGNRVVGVSNDNALLESNIKEAKREGIPKNTLEYVYSDLRTFRNDFLQKFDQIICFEVLEHTRLDNILFKNLVAYLKPGGQILISVPYAVDTQFLYGALEGEHVRLGYDEALLESMALSNGLQIELLEAIGGRYTNRIRELKWRLAIGSGLFKYYGEPATYRLQLYFNHATFLLFSPFCRLDRISSKKEGTCLIMVAVKPIPDV